MTSEIEVKNLTVPVHFMDHRYDFFCIGEVRKESKKPRFSVHCAMTRQSLELVPNNRWADFKEALRQSVELTLGIGVKRVSSTVIDADPVAT